MWIIIILELVYLYILFWSLLHFFQFSNNRNNLEFYFYSVTTTDSHIFHTCTIESVHLIRQSSIIQISVFGGSCDKIPAWLFSHETNYV